MSGNVVTDDPFVVGKDLCWLYGEHYRIGKVLEVEEHRVKVDGMTSQYWIKKSTLLPRLDRVPVNASMGF